MCIIVNCSLDHKPLGNYAIDALFVVRCSYMNDAGRKSRSNRCITIETPDTSNQNDRFGKIGNMCNQIN